MARRVGSARAAKTSTARKVTYQLPIVEAFPTPTRRARHTGRMRRQPPAAVRAAFEATDRRAFLPARAHGYADEDRPLPIGHDQTNSQPRTVADMLTLLDVPVGARVLDVGAGSGWTTALLAHLVGPTGTVVGTEIVPQLQAFGAANLAAVQRPWARIELADPDRLGHREDAPFDRILVSARASGIPQELVDQLAAGGVLVVPVAGRMARITRHGAQIDLHWHGHYLFVPLIEPQARPTPPDRDAPH